MDRYVVREPRVGADYPQGNQLVSYPPNSGNSNNMVPETMYFGGYGAEFPVRQGFMGVTHVNAPFSPNVPNQGSVMSGIDSRYLAGYADNRAASYISGQQNMNRDQTAIARPPFLNSYENRDFFGAERNQTKTFMPHTSSSFPSSNASAIDTKSRDDSLKSQAVLQNTQLNKTTIVPTLTPPSPANNVGAAKTDVQFPVKTRADKLMELHKSGVRVFSGPVEKVLKWHKVLQEFGAMVLYEIVAKCVSIRSGEGSAKNLVVRDDTGPAMQLVYYEIDFLLPELKLPCMIRVVGRMMPGTCRLQAFSVRAASGDDVSTLPRRAAVAAHHVAKLCKECGV